MYEYYLFDFDGTIADTRKSILTGFHHSFETFHVQDHTDEEIQATIGIPLNYAFARLTEKDVEDEIVKTLTAEYRRVYPEIVVKTIQCFPFVLPTLKQLKSNGKKIAIVSSRLTTMIADLSRFLAIDSLVDCYVGEDLVPHKKPAPDAALLALKVLGCNQASTALMIGDTYFDIKMGTEAGLDTCYCSYGYGTRESLSSCPPTLEISRMDELIKI